jgi:hypothetical protein
VKKQNVSTVDESATTSVSPTAELPKPFFLKLKSNITKPTFFVIGLLVVVIALGGWLFYRDYKSYYSAPTQTAPLNELPIPTISDTHPTATPTPSSTPTPTPFISSPSRVISTAAVDALVSATSITQVQNALQTFLSQYGVTLQMLTVTPSTYAQDYATYTILDNSDLAATKEYGSLFIDEWAKYPLDWVENSELQSIVIVDDLFVDGYNRAAMPDPVGSAVYYDPSFSGDYAREVVHHEYNHLITYNYFGSWSPADPVWQSYNPPGFSYGNGGAECYEPDNNCLTGDHPIAGFVTGYATSGIEEDKAELYACLMTSLCYGHLLGWVETDEYLAQKVDNYKQFIGSHSSTMSGTYFDDINI